MYERMLQAHIFQQHSEGPVLTDQGRAWFLQLGIDTDALANSKRTFCRACLDWSERRHHLAGALGSALLTHIQTVGWAKREESSRIITFSDAGEKSLWAMLVLPGEQSTNAKPMATSEAALPMAVAPEEAVERALME